ncbi:MAG: hypothetical protein JWL90_4694 [Chthoniobacteraceae bacterium]|nr:hypothetical protein [Chthoniobacteraceae bacterium]
MKTMTFKVSDDEARHIRLLAKHQKLSISEYLRRSARGGNPAAKPLSKTRCEFTGAEIFAPLLDQPPLSTESIRDMLAEFP